MHNYPFLILYILAHVGLYAPLVILLHRLLDRIPYWPAEVKAAMWSVLSLLLLAYLVQHSFIPGLKYVTNI